MLYKACYHERKELGNLPESKITDLRYKIRRMAQDLFQHECRIIDLMFSEGDIRVVDKDELIEFVKDRVNIVLTRLELEPMFIKENGTISKWFYDQLNTMKVPDFFAGTQIQYRRNWARNKLKFNVGE